MSAVECQERGCGNFKLALTFAWLHLERVQLSGSAGKLSCALISILNRGNTRMLGFPCVWNVSCGCRPDVGRCDFKAVNPGVGERKHNIIIFEDTFAITWIHRFEVKPAHIMSTPTWYLPHTREPQHSPLQRKGHDNVKSAGFEILLVWFKSNNLIIRKGLSNKQCMSWGRHQKTCIPASPEIFKILNNFQQYVTRMKTSMLLQSLSHHWYDTSNLFDFKCERDRSFTALCSKITPKTLENLINTPSFGKCLSYLYFSLCKT